MEENRKQIAYIAGKITDDPNYQEKFADAQKKLERAGYIVLNPTWMPQGMTPAQYMRICLAMIDCADVVFVLFDWRDSPGARLEYYYCTYKGMQPVGFEEWYAGARLMSRIAEAVL